MLAADEVVLGSGGGKGWLGNEWASPADEDDTLVVLLKGRIAHLQAQLAHFTPVSDKKLG